MRMYAVIKKYGYGSTVLALFKYKIDAEDYIKKQMIENIPSELLDFNKSDTLTIENDCYIELLETEIVEEKEK